MSEVAAEAGWLRDTVGVRVLERTFVRVYDRDARTWLQGQITNDVARERPGTATYTLVLDSKGKIQADGWVYDQGSDFLVALPPDAFDGVVAHLERFIVMEDVELEPLPHMRLVTAQGPRAQELLPDALVVDRLGQGGVDLPVQAEKLEERLAELEANAAALGGGLVSAQGWELARVRSAVPAWGFDFDDTTLPQEAGLKERAVSFAKGCYLGQEVVCMLENRGKLRRCLVQVTAERPLETGAELELDGAMVGSLRSVVRDGGQTLGFAMLKRRAATAGLTLTCDGHDVVVGVPVGAGGSSSGSL